MKFFQKIFFAIGAGLLSGSIALFLNNRENKWVVAFTALCCSPFIIPLAGSVDRALYAILIISISAEMGFSLFYSEKFFHPELGVRISLTMMLSVALLFCLIFKMAKNKMNIKLHFINTFPLLLLVLLNGTSYFYAEKPQYVMHGFQMAIENFCVFFIALNFIRNKRDLFFTTDILSFTLIITALITFVQYTKPGLLNFKFMGWAEETIKLDHGGNMITRPSGFLGHPNNLASFLALWLPLPFMMLISGTLSFKKTFLHFLAFSMGCASLVLTFSRGGWIVFALSISWICFFVITNSKNIIFSKITVRLKKLILFSCLAAIPFIPLMYNRLTGDDLGAGESRLMLNKNSLTYLVEKPILGHGSGFYADFNPVPPHNVYLQTAVETGISGLLLLLWNYGIFYWQGQKLLKTTDKQVLMISIGIFSGLIGAFSHGMLELGTIGYHKLMPILFAGAILLCIAAMKPDLNNTSEEINHAN